MVELIQLIFEFLESIPGNAALVLLSGVILYLVRYQDKVNKRNDEKFKSGATNFIMIDTHFTEIKQAFSKNDDQFAVLHEQLKNVHKMVLKDIIYNDSMDPMERQDAYDEYLRLGGNGFTQRYYENILKAKVESHIKGNR